MNVEDLKSWIVYDPEYTSTRAEFYLCEALDLLEFVNIVGYTIPEASMPEVIEFADMYLRFANVYIQHAVKA